MRNTLAFLSICLAANHAVLAATPYEMLSNYRQASGNEASAQRGAAFYARQFGVSARMQACVSCHTEKPTQPGRHVVTGKPIKPMAVAANAERFTDEAKTEKWFRRNCKEVVGRECTSAEKADFIAYMMEVR